MPDSTKEQLVETKAALRAAERHAARYRTCYLAWMVMALVLAALLVLSITGSDLGRTCTDYQLQTGSTQC